MSFSLNAPRVAAILGPTNTGKTHYAVERMLARSSGIIGLPLRLLAREVYDKICVLKGKRNCALITGEEKIVPDFARYYVCTVEAMPVEKRFAFLAVDEIQLMGNPERGHIFTDRLLHARGMEETLFLGAETARDLIRRLLPDITQERRDRFSTLSYGGATKLTRLPKRSVIVAFSAAEVYAIAEFIRRHRGGAAVVMGALSPRTRNAQAELYQSGEVDFLIATDAVGMGLNLDTDHVAFASMVKYDGRRRRRLTPMEAGQIAGRAGRFRNDGTFGTTGDCQPIDPEMIARIESHEFEPMRYGEWRNSRLNFKSVDALLDSLALAPPRKGLRRIAPATDEAALERILREPEVVARLKTEFDIKRLWDICQVPDFRNLTIDAHVRLLQDLHEQLYKYGGKISDDFLARRVARLDHTQGGVDVLSVRLAQIRTWTYCANKLSWMIDPQHWIKRTRAVEDRLSDALHQSLIERFVDRRTSALLKGIGAGNYMDATIKDNGDVWVDDHKIGHLEGLKFKIDESTSEIEAKALQAAAIKAVGPEVDRRLTSLCGGSHDIFTLSAEGEVLWGGKAVGRIAKSGSIFTPDAELIGGEMGNETLRNLATDRMREFLRSEVSKKLEPLSALKTLSENEAIPAPARGFAYVLFQENGSVSRDAHFKTLKDLDQDSRKPLREIGVVFGQYNIFMKDLMKPKPATLLGLLSAYGAGGNGKPFVPFAGVTSIPNTGEFESSQFSTDALSVAGYRACGPRIIRFDIVDRLSKLIRDAQNQAPAHSGPRKFQVMQEMLAILGSTYEEVRGVLEALGYKSETIEPPVEAPANPVEAENAVAGDTLPSAAKTAENIEPSSETQNPSPAVSVTQNQADGEVASESKTETETKKENTSDTPTSAELTSSPPAPPVTSAKKTHRRGPRALNVFHQRVADADGNNVTVPNTEFWSMPFRKNTNARRGKPDGTSEFRGKPAYKGKKNANRKNGSPKSDVKSAEYKAREAKRIEDSPFAALAALKNSDKKS